MMNISKDIRPKNAQDLLLNSLFKTVFGVCAVQMMTGMKIKAYCENCRLSAIIAKYNISDIIEE